MAGSVGGEDEKLWQYQTDSEQLSMTLDQRIAAVYEELRMDVYRYVLTLGPPPELAQDIVQDAFIRLYEALHDGTVIEDIRAWLLRVAHNIAISIVTSKAYTSEQIRESTSTASKSVEDELIDQERRIRLRGEIQRLSTQQRACLELRAQGLRYCQIGEIMGISTSTVGEFLRRAVDRLREALHE